MYIQLLLTGRIQVHVVLEVIEMTIEQPYIYVAISSSMSIAGCAFMVACFMLFEESRRCGRRILLCLSLTDLGASIAWLLTLTPDISNPQLSSETPLVCYIQVICCMLLHSNPSFHLLEIEGIYLAILHTFVVFMDIMFCISSVSDPFERK